MGLKSLAEPFGTKIEPIDSLAERLNQQVENIAIDLLSQFRSANDEQIVLLKPPQRVIGKLNNPQTLTTAIEQIERNAKPQAFLTDSNLKQYLPQTSTEHQWKLNERIFDRLKSVTIESLAESSPAQLQELFNGKTIVIGERDTLINKPITAVNSSSLKDNPTALDSNLYLLRIQSHPEQFIWIFGWCNLSILLAWQMGRRSFVPGFIAVVGTQVIVGGVLLMMGNRVPIVMTSIAIISAEIIIFKIVSTNKS
jgi:hypothetical protein